MKIKPQNTAVSGLGLKCAFTETNEKKLGERASNASRKQVPEQALSIHDDDRI